MQIFHPNVDTAGRICLDILGDKWSAAYSALTLLLSLQSLLGEPNNASPLNAQAAQAWDNAVRAVGGGRWVGTPRVEIDRQIRMLSQGGEARAPTSHPQHPRALPSQVEYRRLVVRKYREATGALPSSGWGSAGET